jgi:hypothetical protein
MGSRGVDLFGIGTTRARDPERTGAFGSDGEIGRSGARARRTKCHPTLSMRMTCMTWMRPFWTDIDSGQSHRVRHANTARSMALPVLASELAGRSRARRTASLGLYVHSDLLTRPRIGIAPVDAVPERAAPISTQRAARAGGRDRAESCQGAACLCFGKSV